MYWLIKLKNKFRLLRTLLRSHDCLLVCRSKAGAIEYHYYASGDQIFYELADELCNHGREWYSDWLKDNQIRTEELV